MKQFLLITASFLIAMNLANAQFIEHCYDYNSLNMTTTYNNLNGVDDWTTVLNQNPSPYPPLDDWHVSYSNKWAVVSPDGSQYMSYDGENTNVGRTASRVSTSALPFDFSIGGVVEIQVDIHRGWWKNYFSFGYDANNNGITLRGIENTLTFESGDGGIGIHMSICDPEFNVFVKPDGSYVNLNINPDSLNAYWFSYKMVVDFDANAGAGSVSLFYKQQNTTQWVACLNVTNLNLGLTPGSGDKLDPAMWTKMLIHGTGGMGVDNICIRQPDTGGLLYQYLSFTPIADHLTTDAPFNVTAVSNQGLTVSYAIASGPATIVGNTITLSGTPGLVEVVAMQPGNATVAPAQNDTTSFYVYDPSSFLPTINITNPVDTRDVNDPSLDAVMLSAYAGIARPDLVDISSVSFTVNGDLVQGYPTNNGFYIGYWTPPSNGSYTMVATATSATGQTASETIVFDVISDQTTSTFTVLNQLDFSTIPDLDTTIVFPSFAGYYSKVVAHLQYNCPVSGCEPWDVGVPLSIIGANGEEMNLFTYITPYGVACQDSIDITDFVSQLQGKIQLKCNFPDLSVITLSFTYYSGDPAYPYSWVDKLWNSTYPFGSVDNQQPVPVVGVALNTTGYGVEVKQAVLRDMSNGHGWGALNTSNASEFYNATHHFLINGVTTFEQHLWQDCNPNPAGCSPQNGTYLYDRHGWCPGTIAMLWRYDLAAFLGSEIDIFYEFDPDYFDLCSPYNPACISGVTCSDCNDMMNPIISVAGQLVTYFDVPPTPSIYDNVVESELKHVNIEVMPNPSNGVFNLKSSRYFLKEVDVQIFDIAGIVVSNFKWDGTLKQIDLSSLAHGVYFVRVVSQKDMDVKKIIIQ